MLIFILKMNKESTGENPILNVANINKIYCEAATRTPLFLQQIYGNGIPEQASDSKDILRKKIYLNKKIQGK